jgi:nitroreductase
VEMTELSNLIKGRRSIRQWQDKPVPAGLLTKAVELATYAPNAGNMQNWRFYVIVNNGIVNAIADAVQDNANIMATWPETIKQGEKAVKGMQRASFFRGAPAAIAVATGKYQSAVEIACLERQKKDPRAATIAEWRRIADSQLQSIGSAVAYLCLILHQMGLGTVWMTGPIQAKGEIEKLLGVPSGMDFVALIPVGYPAESPEPRPRKPVKEVSEIIK